MGRLYHLQQTKDGREKMGPARRRVADDSLDRRLCSASDVNRGAGRAIDDGGGWGVILFTRAPYNGNPFVFISKSFGEFTPDVAVIVLILGIRYAMGISILIFCQAPH